MQAGHLPGRRHSAPHGCRALQAVPQRVRSWAAREEWLAFADFSNQLHSPPFGVLLHCDAWQVSVRLRLLLRVHRLKDARTAAVVISFGPCDARMAFGWLTEQPAIRAPRPARMQPISQLVFPSKRHMNKAVCAVEVTSATQQRQAFTFCLEKVEQGPWKNVWLTVGMRVGDYANV